MTFDPLLSDTSRRPPGDAGPALQKHAKGERWERFSIYTAYTERRLYMATLA